MQQRALVMALFAAGAALPAAHPAAAQDCTQIFVYSVNQVCRTLSNGFSQCQPVGMVGPAPNCAQPGVPPLMAVPLAPPVTQAPPAFAFQPPFPAPALPASPAPVAAAPAMPAVPAPTPAPASAPASVAATAAAPAMAAPTPAPVKAAAVPVPAAVAEAPKSLAPPAEQSSQTAPAPAKAEPASAPVQAPVVAEPARGVGAPAAPVATPVATPAPAPVPVVAKAATAEPPPAPVAATPAAQPATASPASAVPAEASPAAKPAAIYPAQLVLQDGVAHFEFDRAELSQKARAELDAWLRQPLPQGKTLRVTGHADRLGPAPYNMKLSGRRALTVKKYLEGKGVAGKDIKVVAKGEGDPVKHCAGGATKATIACLAPNRRVEIDPE